MNYKPNFLCLHSLDDNLLRETSEIVVPRLCPGSRRIDTTKLFNEIGYEWRRSVKDNSKLVELASKLSYVANIGLLKDSYYYEINNVQDFILGFISSKFDFPNIMQHKYKLISSIFKKSGVVSDYLIESGIIDNLHSLFFNVEFSDFKYIIHCFIEIAKQNKENAQMVLNYFNSDFFMKLINIQDSEITLACIQLVMLLTKLENHGLDIKLVYFILELMQNNFGVTITSFEDNLCILLYLTNIFNENWGELIIKNNLQNQIIKMLNSNNNNIFSLALECLTLLISQGFFVEFDYKHLIGVCNKNVLEKIKIIVDFHQEYFIKFVEQGLFEINISNFNFNEKKSYIDCVITLIIKYCTPFISENAIKSKIIISILDFYDFDSFEIDFISRIISSIHKILTSNIDESILKEGINQFYEADGPHILINIPNVDELNELKNQILKLTTNYD